MPPKLDPSQVVDVSVRVIGCEVGATSSSETAEDWNGLRVTVNLTVQNHPQAKVSVVPSAEALVIKALKEPERDRKKTENMEHGGNISLDHVIQIAKIMKPGSRTNDLAGAVEKILETCASVGCTLDGKDPRSISGTLRSLSIEDVIQSLHMQI